MFLVRTQSGTEYLVRNGRLNRTPGANPYLAPEVAEWNTWRNVLFTNVTTPTVGETWVFTLTGRGDVTTTPVVAVEPYCAGCDTYGDLWMCGRAA